MELSYSVVTKIYLGSRNLFRCQPPSFIEIISDKVNTESPSAGNKRIETEQVIVDYIKQTVDQ